MGQNTSSRFSPLKVDNSPKAAIEQFIVCSSCKSKAAFLRWAYKRPPSYTDVYWPRSAVESSSLEWGS